MSKFSGLLNKSEAAENEPDVEAAGLQPKEPASVPAPPNSATNARPGTTLPSRPPQKARIGRPAGKRSDTKTIQVSAYILEETHIQAKVRLLTERAETGSRLDFSGLVQKLLSEWLAS